MADLYIGDSLAFVGESPVGAHSLGSQGISYTVLTTGTAANATQGVSASISPAANQPVYLYVVAHPSGGPSFPTTITGNGLTWVSVDSANYDAISGEIHALYRAAGASPSSGTVTIDFGVGNTQLDVNWTIIQMSGADTSGTNGSGSVVRSVKASGRSNLAFGYLNGEFGSLNNGTFAFVASGGLGNPVKPKTGSTWTRAATQGGGTTGVYLAALFSPQNDNAAWAHLDAADPWGIIVVEVKAAAAGGAGTIGTAVETDVSLAQGRSKQRLTGVAIETDVSLAPPSSKRRVAGVSTETDLALALTRAKQRAVGVSTERDFALAPPRSKVRSIGLAVETDVALSPPRAKNRSTGISTETDVALPLQPAGGIGLAVEQDLAFALPRTKQRLIGLAVEQNEALAPSLSGGVPPPAPAPVFHGGGGHGKTSLREDERLISRLVDNVLRLQKEGESPAEVAATIAPVLPDPEAVSTLVNALEEKASYATPQLVRWIDRLEKILRRRVEEDEEAAALSILF